MKSKQTIHAPINSAIAQLGPRPSIPKIGYDKIIYLQSLYHSCMANELNIRIRCDWWVYHLSVASIKDNEVAEAGHGEYWYNWKGHSYYIILLL